MHKISTAILLAAATLVTTTAQADGLIHALPKDGTWVSFKMEGHEDKTHRGQEVEHFTGYLKISSVGRETVNGEQCRWVEIEHTWDRTDDPTYDERKQIFKLLIPEKHLRKGAAPGKHVVRGYQVFGTTPPKRQPTAIKKLPASFRNLMLRGPMENAEKLPPKLAPNLAQKKLGKLKCGGVRGATEIDSELPDGVEGLETLPFSFEVRLHEKAPFGVVSYEFSGLEPNNDTVVTKMTLDDFGEGAVSRYPDAK